LHAGVNLKGNFNVDNVTQYIGRDVKLEELIPIAAKNPIEITIHSLEADSSNSYIIFWKLQDLIVNCPAQIDAIQFPKFRYIFNYAVHLLKIIHRSEKEMSRSDSSSKNHHDKLEFAPKYLTDENLFLLQVSSSNF
jgi:hypothetical protein